MNTGRSKLAKTTAQRQEDLRARRAIEGMTEVRGIYLPPTLHPELKKMAAKLAKRPAPANTPITPHTQSVD